MNLTDSFSLFLYAFKLHKNDLDNPESIWKRSKLEPEKNFFFGHVQDFFIKNNSTSGKIDPSCCLRYELRKDNLAESQKSKLLLINQLFSRNSQTVQKTGNKISFRLFLDNSILGPGILYNPLTGICILSFGLSLSKDSNSVQNLIDLNYMVRVFGRPDSGVFTILKNEHPSAADQELTLIKLLDEFDKDLNHDYSVGSFKWSIGILLKILLQDFSEENITILSANRLQCFTYLQTESKFDNLELNTASFRLRRMYNNNYTPPDITGNSTEMEQPFEQIHIASSIEGCAMIVNADKDNLPSFLKNYGVVCKNRYVWSYLLAYYQRLALIEMNTELSHLYDKSHPQLHQLIQVSSNLSKIELRTFFAQVSFFSQHNDFYEFCKRNLKLGEMYAEIKAKLSGINRIALEETEREEKLKEKKREKKDRLLEVMIAALLIPEIIFEFLSMLEHVFEVNFPMENHHFMTYLLFVFASLLMLTVIPFAVRIYKEYYQVVRSYIKKEEPDDNLGLKKRYLD
jgi:hypothetical protein